MSEVIIPIVADLDVEADVLDFDLDVSESAIAVSMDVETAIVSSIAEDYDGPTEITPTEETQTLFTEGKHVLENIVVNPIPSNYGLITWDGTIITVS